MTTNDEKCVVILNADLPLGVLANTATILGISLGKFIPHQVGPSVFDQSNLEHTGVIQIPVPILQTNTDKIKSIRETIAQPKYEELMVVDFSDVAQSCLNYDDYIMKMAKVESTQLNYFGLAIYGTKKLVNKLTGDLPLLR